LIAVHCAADNFGAVAHPASMAAQIIAGKTILIIICASPDWVHGIEA
jgi:hypothetical protein